ncbi:helix-turn-helix domain-containing protein [Hyphomicrobium sp.]|uniref:MerR family transcriptional regulator n=1 Tax=Hyphomicrobium sp. TaxID=82 RepID=UPI003562517D
MSDAIPIGVLSQKTGVKVPTIRYYEGVGLMPEPSRTEANRRLYGAEAVDRLRFIRHARELGFEVDAIRQLLDLSDEPEKSCKAVDAIARHHLSEIRSRIARLRALEREVQRMLAECACGRISECRVIDVLSHKHYIHHDK